MVVHVYDIFVPLIETDLIFDRNGWSRNPENLVDNTELSDL